jgi:hypothetical protein
MSDPFEDEMEKRQKLIAEKLAEIGIAVQIPVQFLKIPGGPIGGQLAFTWDDTKQLNAALEADDEFAQIVAAEKEADRIAREEQVRKDEEQALLDLQRLADGVLEDDDDE